MISDKEIEELKSIISDFETEDVKNFLSKINNQEMLNCALLFSYQNSNYEVTSWLLESGKAKINSVPGTRAYNECAEKGSIQYIDLFIKHGAYIQEGLKIASINNNLEIVKHLVENGADLTVKMDALLCFAVKDIDILKLLINKGLPLKHLCYNIINLSCMHGDITILSYLLEEKIISSEDLKGIIIDSYYAPKGVKDWAIRYREMINLNESLKEKLVEKPEISKKKKI